MAPFVFGRPLLGKLNLLCDELEKAVPVCVSNGMRMKKLGNTVPTLPRPVLPVCSWTSVAEGPLHAGL